MKHAYGIDPGDIGLDRALTDVWFTQGDGTDHKESIDEFCAYYDLDKITKENWML